MVVYICEKCDKKFNQKSTYDNHIKRKNPCYPIKNKMEEINDNLEKKIQEIFSELDTQRNKIIIQKNEIKNLHIEIKELKKQMNQG